MVAALHRENDTRVCTATTIVVGQNNVYVNGKLAAVVGDINTHGAGELFSTTNKKVFINGKEVINILDDAYPDNLGHPAPPTAPNSGAPNVFV